jgi:F-type H+-transporting ATPase subunit delta
MHSAVARRYAKALIEVVLAPGFQMDPKKTLEELRSIQELIAGSTPLHIALLSPAVSPSRKRAVVGRLIGPMNVSKAVRNFLFVVIDHRRIQEWKGVVEAFDALLDERLGFVRAGVASASALTEPQKTSLEAELSRLSGKKAKLTFTIDPALIGGVLARVGSMVYDGSVRGQLERLRLKLGSL